MIGILAHVDAGKTTLIESMLYTSKEIRKLGRVDHGDTQLDYDSLERDHGITIYSKEAFFRWKGADIYVLDTPGHVDFSAEMERVLQVLDLAVVLINGQDGVQSHTETIMKCLEFYKVPAVFFVNKMDISYHSEDELLADLVKVFSDKCVAMGKEDTEEHLATINEEMMNAYLEGRKISEDLIENAVVKRELFPVYFGSALKIQGVEEFMDAVSSYAKEKEYPEEFGARVYKVSADEQGNRLTHMKITGGILKTKQKLNDEEKADQIRIYSGKNYRLMDAAEAGTVCAVKGLSSYEPGAGIGFEEDGEKRLLNAFVNYELVLPAGINALAMSETMNELAKEDPALEIHTDAKSKKIRLQIMGEMQKEVLRKKIAERTGVFVEFGTGRIVYRETIRDAVIGFGHFEPLRHYAEVAVKIEPAEKGAGILVQNRCPSDDLPSHWQKTVMDQLTRIRHKGVLTGSDLTDVKISFLAGRGHLKHTETYDFREASVRAVRQALMKAESVLLEPYYAFTLEVPSESLSRALFDLEKRGADISVSETPNGMCVTGKAPVRNMVNYRSEVLSYTRGKGRFTFEAGGYEPVKDEEEVVREFAYDPEADLRNPPGSVFCKNGAGYYVPWDEVDDMAHIDLSNKTAGTYERKKYTVSEEELKEIMKNTSMRNRNEKKHYTRKKDAPLPEKKHVKAMPELPVCLIVDGYNMIYAWNDLKEISRADLSLARNKLIDRIFSYAGYEGYKCLLVFDGYKRPDNAGSSVKDGEMTIVYTRTNETADSYIEKVSADLKKQYRLLVATSDELIQNAVFAHGALRISARELEMRLEGYSKNLKNL